MMVPRHVPAPRRSANIMREMGYPAADIEAATQREADAGLAVTPHRWQIHPDTGLLSLTPPQPLDYDAGRRREADAKLAAMPPRPEDTGFDWTEDLGQAAAIIVLGAAICAGILLGSLATWWIIKTASLVLDAQQYAGVW